MQKTQKQIKEIRFSVIDSSLIIRKLDSGHVAFPDIVRLKNDSLLIAYREGIAHVDTQSRITKQFGSPDGKSWSEPETLYDHPGIDDRDPSLEVLDNGYVITNYFKYVRGSWYERPTLIHTFAGRSADNGKTFIPSVQVDEGELFTDSCYVSNDSVWVNSKGEVLQGFACSGAITKFGNRLLLPAYGGYPLVRRRNTLIFVSPLSTIALFESNDNGSSWTKNRINIPGSDTVWLQEPSLLNLGDSLLLMHIRTANGKSIYDAGKMAQTISKDGGKTWSQIEFFPFTGHAPELFRLSCGVILCAFRYVNNEYTEESVAFIYSIDFGNTWSDPVFIEYCGEEECGYPAFAELNDSTFMIVYYGNNGKTIKNSVFCY
ncbi:MAG: glycoside hydrolase [Bacteroidetes bacterium]|nr:glycoside hydrolase [Bacteroidota bacterium]